MGQALTVKFEIHTTSGKIKSVAFTERSSWTVGRSRRAHLSLADDLVCSRFHCRFEVQPPACIVADLESRNGTRVNGKRIAQPTDLFDNDSVRIGDTEIRVRIDQPAAIPETETVLVEDMAEGLPQLPNLTVKRKVGEGSMGTVFIATQQPTGREVAVKMLAPTGSSEVSLQYFVREAAIATQLEHPNIVKTTDFGIHDGVPFLVMEYVDTTDLEGLLGRPGSASRIKIATGVVSRLLKALAYAHDLGFVHRDIKPSNLLTYRKRGKLLLKLADFGLAKNFESAGLTALSTSNEIKGTAAYMSPEQVLDCRYAKPSCDLYSTGVVLYELISGQRPFQFDSMIDAFTTILNKAPMPLEEHCPCPEALKKLVMKSIHKEPAKRFATANEMLQAIQRIH